ncbi:MAG: DEAD/DEAH box helicase [Phycisphaeraceae bacterium]|nr:DEAD/DEAH box helicase [Phycisphaeraceae bacterium]
MTFETLGLIEPIRRAIVAEGYTAPTPIQSKAIPHALTGGDVLGSARTGTGKTAAFAIPILQRLSASAESAPAAVQGHRGQPRRAAGSSRDAGTGSSAGRPRRAPRALILCPTRELAAQIAESFTVYGRHLRLATTAIFGGVGQQRQVDALRRGVDILIATPGRLQDLLNQRLLDLGGIEILVLDEADRMLDMGFIADIRRIVKHVPATRQTLMFSATMPGPIRELADTLLRDPLSAEGDRAGTPARDVTQSVCFVTKKSKPMLLEHMLRTGEMGRTIVFTRTKHGADRVVRHLTRVGLRAEAIHGNKSQNARVRALDAFRSRKPPVLVATDIASRGIDVDDVSHVVNFDIPNEPETYVHRIGRTARAGASGIAISFCDHDERSYLRQIERLIDRRIDVQQDLPELPDAPVGSDDPGERPERRSDRPARGGRSAREGGHRGASNGKGRTPAPNASRGRAGKAPARRTDGPRDTVSAPERSAPRPVSANRLTATRVRTGGGGGSRGAGRPSRSGSGRASRW